MLERLLHHDFVAFFDDFHVLFEQQRVIVCKKQHSWESGLCIKLRTMPARQTQRQATAAQDQIQISDIILNMVHSKYLTQTVLAHSNSIAES